MFVCNNKTLKSSLPLLKNRITAKVGCVSSTTISCGASEKKMMRSKETQNM